MFAYIYVAHTAFCVYVWHGSELRMRVVKTFERRQQSADDCLRIFVHGDMQLPWVYDTHTLTLTLIYVTHTLLLSLLLRMFPCCNSRLNISSRSCHWALWASLHHASVAETHACMFIHTCMHANSYTETVTCMRGLHNGEIRFTSTNVVFKQS